MRGEGGVGVACASALARGPVGGGRRPRFPSNSKGILEFPSNGIRGNSRSVLEVLCVVSGTSCNHHLGLEADGKTSISAGLEAAGQLFNDSRDNARKD